MSCQNERFCPPKQADMTGGAANTVLGLLKKLRWCCGGGRKQEIDLHQFFVQTTMGLSLIGKELVAWCLSEFEKYKSMYDEFFHLNRCALLRKSKGPTCSLACGPSTLKAHASVLVDLPLTCSQ